MYDLIGWLLFLIVFMVYMILIILEYSKALTNFCILTHAHIVVTFLGAENTGFSNTTFILDITTTTTTITTTAFLITTRVKLDPKEVQKKHYKSLSKIN